MYEEPGDRAVSYKVRQNGIDRTWHIVRSCMRLQSYSQRQGSFENKEDAEKQMRKMRKREFPWRKEENEND